MKFSLCCVLFITSLWAYSQTPLTNDSIYLESRFSELSQRIEKLQSGNSTLEKDLLYYRAKEDFYAAALNEQATRFTVIVTGILGLFAFFSWAGFHYEVKNYKAASNKKVKSVSKTFKKSKKELVKLQTEHFRSEGNLAASISYTLREKKLLFESGYYSMAAADAHNSHYDMLIKNMTIEEIGEKGDGYNAVFGNLKIAENIFTQLNNNGSTPLKDIEEFEKSFKKVFNNLLSSKNHNVIAQTAGIYSQYQILCNKSLENSKKNGSEDKVKTNSTSL